MQVLKYVSYCKEIDTKAPQMFKTFAAQSGRSKLFGLICLLVLKLWGVFGLDDFYLRALFHFVG